MAFSAVSKRVLAYGNEFDVENNEHARKPHFNMKGCEPRLVLKQRYLRSNSEITYWKAFFSPEKWHKTL